MNSRGGQGFFKRVWRDQPHGLEPPLSKQHKTCWIFVDKGKMGTENQCIGLAQALEIPYTVKRVYCSKWLKFFLVFHPALSLRIFRNLVKGPWPSLVIGGGHLSSFLVASMKNPKKLMAPGQGFKRIQVLKPPLESKAFDWVIVPQHDAYEGPQVIQSLGSLTALTQEALQEGKRSLDPQLKKLPSVLVAVLMGGTTKRAPLSLEMLKILLKHLKNLMNTQDVGVLMTTSRRTPPAFVQYIQKDLEGMPALVWTGKESGPNPYKGFLGAAHYILVTEDSVSMTSEACYTGKPVYTIALPGQSSKIKRFHKSLRDQGYTRVFTGVLESWSYVPLRETQRIAHYLGSLLQQKEP